MILTSQDQLKNLDNVGAVLVYPSKITTSGLIQSATSNDLVVNCIVDDDPDNAFIGQSLSQLGYPSGCYIVINYQSKKDVKDITGAFSNNLQLGYRAAIIVNKSDYTQDELKDLQQYGIVVIDHKDIKDSLLNVPNFLKTRSVAMMRDYTNVDISGVGPGAFVGVGKDTSGLGGGRSFGYSTNGQDFYSVITPKGLVFRQIDALRMWRLLKPQQAAQIGDFFNNKVAKEIEAQNESLKSAVATATSAVNVANQAVNDSKVNSDAINAMKSAESEARADADKAISDAQAAIKNVASDAEAIRQNVASVAGQVNSAQAANEAVAKQLQVDLDKAKQSISDTSKSLANVSANLDTYAKSAAEQGHDITELKSQQGKIEADLASANGNVTQLQATVSGIQGNLKDTNDNVDALSATASQAGLALKNAQSQVAQVIARADKFQATIAEQDKKIVDIKATADGASVAASNANSTATEAKLTASAASVTASDAKSDVLTATTTASDAKLTATNANSQAMQANATASSVSVDLKGIKSDAKKISDRVTTNETNIVATQKGLQAKADQATVDNLNKTVSSQAGEIQANANGLLLKADKTITDALNKSFQEQQAQQKILADQITSKVSSADVEKMVDGKGFVTKDLVESSITQASGKINETITNLQGNLQNITADLTGLQATVKNKADVSQITQLNNLISTKVNQDDYKSAITQLGDDINARVQKGDLISQINLEAGQTLIESKKLFLDADSVVFSGKAFIPDAAIENLSLDKLTTGSLKVPLADDNGNQIELGNDGINIISGLVVEDSANSGSASSNSGSDSFQKLGYGVKLTSSGLKMYQHRQYAKTTGAEPKSEDFTLLDVNPIKSPASNDSKKLPEGLAFMIQTQKYSSVLGPETPHNFLALGRRYYKDATDDTGTDFYDVVYSAEDGNGYPVGLHVNAPLYIKPYGADHGIRFAWVSWSAWDFGERYPAIVNDTANWGGIAFPSSGKATIFDAYGKYSIPDKDTGHGSYNGYGG